MSTRTAAFPSETATVALLPPVEAVDGLDRDRLIEVVTQAAAIQARAMARLALLNGLPAPSVAQEELLSAREAAGLLDMSEDWVRRHGESEGFAVRVGRRSVKYSRRRIERYLQRRGDPVDRGPRGV